MLANYFKIAWRNLTRRKTFSVVNIAGLAVGMASAILIFLWIDNEISHDRFHAKGDRIYLLFNRDKFNGQLTAASSTPKILGPAIKNEFPEVEDIARTEFRVPLFTVGEKQFHGDCYFTDSGFLKIFSFPLLEGNATTALRHANYIVITEKFAKKLFGDGSAIGKTIKVDTGHIFTVTGVLKDLPNNTAFDFDCLIPWSFLSKIKWDDDDWNDNSVSTYILLKPQVSQKAFDKKIRSIAIDHTKGTANPSAAQVFSWPLKKVWLYSKNDNGQLVGGRVQTVRLFGFIAIFILLIACINFTNLSTARSEKRAKEVGIRKVVGARQRGLIGQFITESILLALIAGIISLILVQLVLPGFNTVVNKELHLDYSNGYFWLAGVAFVLCTGLLAGSYPAFFLSSFKPVKVLKGVFRSGQASVSPRKILVIVQFTFAIILIISTMIVERQIQYSESRDIGYNNNNLLISFMEGNMYKNYDLIKEGLLNSRAAVGVTKSMSPITQHFSDSRGFSWDGSTTEDSQLDFVRTSSDADFVKTMGVKLLQGRDIDIKNYPGDSTAVMLNETAVKKMRLQNPLGMIINEGDRHWQIVGVTKDFVMESPFESVQPMMINGPASWFNVMHIKLNPEKPISEDLKLAEQVFREFNPQYPFSYFFADETYARKFQDTKRTGLLTSLFAGLTIFISCLGLFALAAYTAEYRFKEIGVRRVLGASVVNITTLLSKDFLKLIVIAFMIALPIAWYVMSKWLQGYTYRIGMEWWIFVVTGLLSLMIALATVGLQAIKAAIANPLKSLRSE